MISWLWLIPVFIVGFLVCLAWVIYSFSNVP